MKDPNAHAKKFTSSDPNRCHCFRIRSRFDDNAIFFLSDSMASLRSHAFVQVNAYPLKDICFGKPAVSAIGKFS